MSENGVEMKRGVLARPELESAAFIVSSTQVALDSAMLSHDIWGTRAHVLMLSETGIISERSAAAICRALDQIEKDVAEGTFRIDPERGAHLSLERAVISLCGVEDGSRMHTARSRNDQVMTTEMLYLRERALELARAACGLADTLLGLAAEHTGTVMPGYTHMQPAKPTTLGQWALAYASATLRCLDSLRHVWDQYDASPLGAVESYGTSWPIDRAFTARLLGFDRVWEVPQDAISSRGLPQLAYLDVCKQIAITVSKMAADLLLFTTWEYGYLRLGEAVAQRGHPITGSSVMPQKRNPDVLELLRATGHEVIGLAGTASHLLAGLPMGYNRDTREMKEWSALGFDKTLAALRTLITTLATVRVERERMMEAVRENYSCATELADMVAQSSGVGYRQIYAVVGKLVDRMIEERRPLYTVTAQELGMAAEEEGLHISVSDEQVHGALDPTQAVSARRHTGGSAREGMACMLEARRETLARHELWCEERSTAIAQARVETLVLAQALQDPLASGGTAAG